MSQKHYTEEQLLLALEILRVHNLRGIEIRFEDILIKIQSSMSFSNLEMIEFADWYSKNSGRYSDDYGALMDGSYLRLWQDSKVNS